MFPLRGGVLRVGPGPPKVASELIAVTGLSSAMSFEDIFIEAQASALNFSSIEKFLAPMLEKRRVVF